VDTNRSVFQEPPARNTSWATFGLAAATTAGMVRLFIHDGTNARLYDEVPVIPVTPGASAPAWSVALGNNTPLSTGRYPLMLPTGFSLRASTHSAEAFSIHAIGGDFQWPISEPTAIRCRPMRPHGWHLLSGAAFGHF